MTLNTNTKAFMNFRSTCNELTLKTLKLRAEIADKQVKLALMELTEEIHAAKARVEATA